MSDSNVMPVIQFSFAVDLSFIKLTSRSIRHAKLQQKDLPCRKNPIHRKV